MKRLLSILLSIFLVVTSCVSVAYADNNNGKSKQKPSITLTGEQKNKVNSKITKVESLMKQLKNKLKDKIERKALLKQIVELRKLNNDNSMLVLAKGNEVKFDVPPVIKYGRTLIPVRAITNAMGAEVSFNPETKTVTVTKTVEGQGEITIVIPLGSNKATVNGIEVEIGCPADLISNRTMVPLRFIAENLKLNVDYDNDTGSVVIDDEQETEQDSDTTDETSGEVVDESTDKVVADETADEVADETTDETADEATDETTNDNADVSNTGTN